MLFGFDGSLIDVATICVGLISILGRMVRRRVNKIQPLVTTADAVKDFLNGAMFVPFVTLIFAPFSTVLLQEVLRTSKLSICLAGVVGALFVIGDFFAPIKR